MPHQTSLRSALVPSRLALLALAVAALGSAAAVGSVRGQVLDTRGRPVAGARIWIKPAFTSGLGEAVTDAQGRYVVEGLPEVGYRAYAWLQLPSGEGRLCYRLMPTAASNAFVPRANTVAVQDFRWQLAGRTPDLEDFEDSATVGGTLAFLPSLKAALDDEGRVLGPDERLELRLAPTGPLVDGSAGKVLTPTTDRKSRVYDVPVGAYRVRATMVGPGGKRTPVRISDHDGDFSDEATLAFRGFDGRCTGRTSGPAGYANLYYVLRD